MIDFRKLIGFGKSSLVVSLPKGWLHENGLAKGDLVYIQPDKDELVVSAKERRTSPEPRRAIINAEGKSLRKIESEIVSAYLNNADIWEIRGSNLRNDGHQVKEVLQNLAGMEVLEHDPSKIVAKGLLDMDGLSVEAMIRRVDLIIRSMMQDATACVHEDFHESILHRDQAVNRMVFLVKRLIRSALEQPSMAKKLGKANKDLLRDWELASHLESVGDAVKRASRFLKSVDIKHKRHKDLKVAFTGLHEKYLEVMRAYHTGNKDLALQVDDEHKARMEAIDRLGRGETDQSIVRLVYHMKGLSSGIKDIARAIVL